MSRQPGAAGRYLLVTASMGAGHDQVAHELAGRFRATGADAHIVDLLAVLPAGIGRGLRSGYAGMLRRAPWLYEAIYQIFFVPREGVQPSTSPLVILAARRLAAAIEEYRPTAVVSTFHLSGQAVGRLRRRGRLDAPGVVVIVDSVAHNLWLDAGNDLFVCVFPSAARQAQRTGRPAIAPGPIIDGRFGKVATENVDRRALGLAEGRDAVLVSTGSWGTGEAVATARTLATVPGVQPVVLCGRNDRLRRQAAAVPGVLALGWRDDLPELFAAASVLIDNAAGATMLEAFAAGVPVVSYRPIPGHGRVGVAATAAAGLTTFAADDAALVDAVGRLRRPGPDRDGQNERVAALFAGDAAADIMRWVAQSSSNGPNS